MFKNQIGNIKYVRFFVSLSDVKNTSDVFKCLDVIMYVNHVV